ncbi:MAG: (2Fe-2S)-binding protein [Candidatus Eisenbacteria bacterium]|nr:(2Fe-2S)-binding protein [Candidatus Eisenbacteria bacterium]
MKTFELSFSVNEKVRKLSVPYGKTLLEILRYDLGLTGTKEGCGKGDCGACTVMIDDEPVNSCLVLAPQVEGRTVITVEGLGDEKALHPIQEAFLREGAVQCGFCTPGILMAAKALLDKKPRPRELDVRKAISGNLCRCTGYAKIVKAILSASGTD